MNKLKKIIKYNKQMMLFISIICLSGIIAGSIFTVLLNNSDKNTVMESVKKFTNNINHDTYNYINSLKNILLPNTLLTLFIWILGISIIGAIIVVIILFYKSFILGFTIGSLILTYNLKGLIISFIYVFPPLILNILVFMYLSSYSIKLSIILIKSIIGKKNLNFKSFINNYLKVLVISFIIIVVSCLYEIFINPYILKYIINLLI